MKALQQLESLIQDLVEKPGWLLRQRRLHPIELAAALTRAMESDALPLADRVIAPDGYALRLNPVDYRQFAGVRGTLEREYAEYLTRLADERGLTLNVPASVAIVEAREVRAGAVEIATRFTEEPGGPPRTIATRLSQSTPAETEIVRVARPSAPVTGVAALEVLDAAGGVRRRYELDGRPATIGRRSSSDISLADPEVSRQHARIELAGPGYRLQDLGSTNGTLVNGRRIAGSVTLADGDTIEVGRSRLRFRRGG